MRRRTDRRTLSYERRAESRYARRIPVFIEIRDQPLDLDGRPRIIKGYTTNFSRRGFQIVTRRRLTAGDLLRLYVLEHRGEALNLIGEVRWSRSHNGRNRHGLYVLEARNTDYLLWCNRAARASVDLTPEIIEPEDEPAGP